MTFSGAEAWLTFVDSKTFDKNCVIFIPKWGLDIATAKTNKIKTINEDKTTRQHK